MADVDSRTDFTPRHVRAARALLAWSQQDLAKAAGVATSTVADFERGQRTPIANNVQAIRDAFENEKIQFLPNGAVLGPTVPIVIKSDNRGIPIRWVSAEELSKWADSIDGAMSLPTLLDYLIRATHGAAILLRFPADEAVRYAGWDGYTSTETDSQYVPKGEAGWELSAQRSKIGEKASADYRKRTADPGRLDPTRATYVFVTSRHWPKKDEWAKARKDEGHWLDVRAYDVDDLVPWIEQTPAVGLWLATRLGKRPTGVRELEEVWKEWSLATQWPLTADLVLSDRDKEEAEVLRWLRGKPSVFSLRGTTTDEVLAFFHATLSELPVDWAAAYRARCLVATTADAARAVANAATPLILLLTSPEPGLARSLAERHHVLQACDELPIGRGEVRSLARPTREGIASALTAAGVARPRAEALARDSACNLAVLRRLIPGAPGRLPKWAEKPDHALLAALLVGAWDENVEGDKALLAQLSAQPYEAIIAALNPYVGEFDQPLQKVGSCWRVASPYDAWFHLAGNLTSTDITRFEAAAHAVLGSTDPRFDLPPDERWMAAVRGVRPSYSESLRHGIGQVLILLALWGNQVRTIPDADRRADAIVRRLLEHADRQRWWSLSRDFRLLAEASPDTFLSAIEDSLDQSDPPIAVLFENEKGGLLGTEHLSDLMWALQSLAWSPDWMPRVTRVLARLDAIDPKNRQYSNGPANSLREIHLLWGPQTFATLDQRLRALDSIRKKETNAAWNLMLRILPQGFDTSSSSQMPRWRDFIVDKAEPVTRRLIDRGAAEISRRLLEDVGLDPTRWSKLLERLSDLAPEDAKRAFVALEAAEPQVKERDDRAAFWEKLRSELHRHRQFPDAEWSLPEEVLAPLESLYDRFSPTDPLDRWAWLFRRSVQLPKPSTSGWEAEERDVDAARKQAAQEVYAQGGLATVLSLAKRTEAAGYLGKALYDSGLSAAEIDSVLETGVRSDDARERELAQGMIPSVFRDRKQPWAEALIARAKAENWGDTALLAILRAFPIGRWTWDLVAQMGVEFETTYWRQTPVFWMENSEDVAYAIRRLIGVGRARNALPLAAHADKVHVASDLLVEVLHEAADQPLGNSGDSNEVVMFQYYVEEILQLLDERDDVKSNTLTNLEWKYLLVLEHSRRPAKFLPKMLSEQPSSFIEILRAAFKPSEESGVVEPEPQDAERAHAVATHAYRLLEQWDHIPATRNDGTIDVEGLKAWIKEVRALAKEAGRADIADDRIGKALSASPMGLDGNWPAEPVREVIDAFRSKPMIAGFRIGKRNRRGVTTRGLRDGGKLEREEAAKYRKWANGIEHDHPETAKALAALAQSYDQEARRQDEKAERLDWES